MSILYARFHYLARKVYRDHVLYKQDVLGALMHKQLQLAELMYSRCFDYR